jgi:hypothetical protein
MEDMQAVGAAHFCNDTSLLIEKLEEMIHGK